MQNALLPLIESPFELRKLSPNELPQLADELRSEIIQVVAAQEGHLGASLGVVELTLALHYVFNTPDDLLVWDVGHQAYGHKMLTGRLKAFDRLRQWDGLSGFPKREESPYDPFGTGHSSTALSAVFSEAPAYPNEAEMDNQMNTNSTQWVILGHAVGNTSKAKQSTVGQDATKRAPGGGVNPRAGGEGCPKPLPDPPRNS